MALKKQSKSMIIMVFNIFLIAGALIFLFYNYRSKSHLLIVKNHLPWKVVEEKVFYDPLYHTSLSAALQVGDLILNVNGVEITNSSVLRKVFFENLHRSLNIKVLRNQKESQYEIKPGVLLFEPEGILQFLPLLVMAIWYSLFNKKNFLLKSLLYLQIVLAVTFCHNSYFYTGPFILFTLGSAYPLCFYLISLQSLKKNRRVWLFKLIIGISYSVVVTFQITAYINHVHEDLLNRAFIFLMLLNQGGFLCFIFYLAKKLKNSKRQNKTHTMEWQFSGFLLFYIPYLFFEVLPLLLKGVNLNLVAAGSYSFLFLSSYFIFALLAKFIYRPVFLRPLEDKWLYFLFNVSLFLFIPFLCSKLLESSDNLITSDEVRLFLLFGSMLIFLIFFVLKKIIPSVLLRFLPNQRIYLKDLHLYMYRKTQEEYYWKHRFHQLEEKLLSNHCSFGINHVHHFFMSSKAQLAQFLNLNEKSLHQGESAKAQWNQLLSLNQYLQNLCDKTKPVIDTACKIEIHSFLKTILSEFSEHPLVSSLILKKTSDLNVVINQQEVKFILHELIKNALEAMDTTDSCVELSAKRTMGHLIISVIDSGTGIFPNQRENLFSPFYTTKSNHLGMGLYISHLYAVKNHGLISYSKVDNGGSCFQLFLPEKSHSSLG